MRKGIIILILSFAGLLFAQNSFLQQRLGTNSQTANISHAISGERDIPDYEFLINPISLLTNFYDFMPGSYCGSPLRILSDGNAYAVFHAQETSYGNRRVYYSFIEQDGNCNVFTIGVEDLWEGYPSLAIDPVTNDPFVAWHGDVSDFTDGLEIMFTYDIYHVIGSGFWKEPFCVIDANVPSENEDDEFIWPYVYVGSSPISQKRRVYVSGNNYYTQTEPSLSHTEDIMLAYADFDGDDLMNQSELAWSYNQVEQFNAWNSGDPIIRSYKACAVSPENSRIAYMGYNTNNEMFVVYNDNYGEGDWTYVSIANNYPVENPLDENGNPTFTDNNGNALDIAFSHRNDRHFNAMFTESGTKLWTVGAFGLYSESADQYWSNLIFPKAFYFDFVTEEFSFVDLDITGANPSDNIPMLPWDLDEDGVVDSFDENGDVQMTSGWPCYYHEEDFAYSENQFYLAANEENGWMAAVWMDGIKNKYAQADVENYEDWLEVAEIAIAISIDNGATWKEPIRLNNLETPEITNLKPCYVYPGDIIEDVGDGFGKLHLMFLDDYSFGSSIQDNGNSDGGAQSYMALKIDFTAYQGYISGTVSDGDLPLENATVSAIGTDQTVTTDENGFYSFQLVDGAYDLLVTAVGYEDATIYGVEVISEQTVTVDIEMIALPTISVSGYVFGSDYPEVGLTGAEVKLDGYGFYETVSDENGFYEILDIYVNNNYDVEISYAGYETYLEELAVESDNVEMEDIILSEMINPVTNVVAIPNDDYTIMYITWDAPGNGDRLYKSRKNIFRESVEQKESNYYRNLESYTIHRLLSIDQENPENWVMLANDVTTLSYTDLTFSNCDPGVYLYAIAATYTNGLISEPAFSAINWNGPYATVNFEITANDGVSTEGSQITLSAQDGELEHIYNGVVDEDGFAEIEYVWYETYDLEISLFNHEDYVETEIIIVESQTLTIELLELLQPISNLEGELNGSQITLTWDAPAIIVEEIYEDFESAHIPYSWQIADADGDGYNWESSVEQELAFEAHSGVGSMISASWVNSLGALTPDNYLITPPILARSSTQIAYWVAAQDPNYPAEHYQVKVSTSGISPTDFTDIIFEETLDSVEWQQIILDLSNYDGEIIYVAWNHCESNDIFYMKIDDVIVDYSSRLSRSLICYNVKRDGEVIATDINETSYVDVGIESGTYLYEVAAVYTSGVSEYIECEPILDDANNDEIIAVETNINGNYPNPFNPTTTISFSIGMDNDNQNCQLDIYNIKGQKVKTLINDNLGSGEHQISWNGKDQNSKIVSSGIYFYRLQVNDITLSKRMMLLK